MSDLPKLASPAQRALAHANVLSLKDLSKFTEAQISDLHGMGPNAMKTIKKAMKEKGLVFTSNS